jgi:hypothetical protein
LVTIDSVNGKLQIVGEEMLASRLMATNEDTYNALSHPNFFLREGNNITIDKSLKPAELLETNKYCQNDRISRNLCVNVHQYAIAHSEIDTSLLSLLNKKVFFGNTDSDQISFGLTQEFRTIREELLDSLPGIHRPATLFETRFNWSGDEKFTDFHSALTFQTEGTNVKRGQWAFISETDPTVFSMKEIKGIEERTAYYSKLDSIDGSDLRLFSANAVTLLISYEHYTECGDDLYENITLWNTSGDLPLFVRTLPGLPAMIFDLDNDGDLDILYEEQILNDPLTIIHWQEPNYALHGQDTVFLTCGC